MFYYMILMMVAPFVTSCLIWRVYFRHVKKIKPIKGEYRKIGHGSKLKRLFIDFPRQLVHDKLMFNPDYFREFGVHIMAGKQGSGKTVTVAYLLMWYMKMYPKVRVRTNFDFVHQHDAIYSWHDIIATNNDIFGEIIVIDEIQNWFNSMQSRDFPPEMLTEITQQRKQIKCIIGTSQVFERVAKPIREQTYMLYQPFTIKGCLTVVFKFEPIIKASDGNVDKKKFRGLFFFVHNKELRESFDTYKKIERLAADGFKPSSEQMSAQTVVNVRSAKK